MVWCMCIPNRTCWIKTFIRTMTSGPSVIDNSHMRSMPFVSPDIGVVSVMNIVIVNGTRTACQLASCPLQWTRWFAFLYSTKAKFASFTLSSSIVSFIHCINVRSRSNIRLWMNILILAADRQCTTCIRASTESLNHIQEPIKIYIAKFFSSKNVKINNRIHRNGDRALILSKLDTTSLFICQIKMRMR